MTNKEPFQKIYFFDKNLNGIQNFRTSLLSTCPISYYKNLTSPKPYEVESYENFEKGSEIHNDLELLQSGARNIISKEKAMKIIHISKKFTISGHYDFLKFDLSGRYLEDLKSSKFESFYFFLNKKEDFIYLFQLSLYAYLYYIENGFMITKGVITKIDKSNPRNRISKEIDLLPIPIVRELILNHPTIKFFFKEITSGEFNQICKEYLINKNITWLCSYCQYPNECAIYPYIQNYLLQLEKDKINK